MKELIEQLKKENQDILHKNPKLAMEFDWSGDAYRLQYNEETIGKLKNLIIADVSKRLEMRKQASNVFELTKGFTTEPTDNAMKTALEMAHNVMVLTADLDGQ